MAGSARRRARAAPTSSGATTDSGRSSKNNGFSPKTWPPSNSRTDAPATAASRVRVEFCASKKRVRGRSSSFPPERTGHGTLPAAAAWACHRTGSREG